MEKYPAGDKSTIGQTLGARILAFIVDGVITVVLSIVLLLVAFALAAATGSDAVGALVGLLYLASPLFFFGYFIGMEGLYGYTLGKKALGLVVVKEDGTNVDMVTSLIRNLLRIVDSLPFAYILGLIVMLVTEKGQRVGDLAASTVVVKQK